jgi:hypothetical protein
MSITGASEMMLATLVKATQTDKQTFNIKSRGNSRNNDKIKFMVFICAKP